jgi:hypothetical protein
VSRRLNPEAIPKTSNRLEEGSSPVVDLATQVRDHFLDYFALAAEVVLPDVFEDLISGEHSLRVLEEITENAKLRRRYGNEVATPRDTMRREVEAQIVVAQDVGI